LELKEKDDYHVYLTLCYEPWLIEANNFAATLKEYRESEEIIREMNREIDKEIKLFISEQED